MCLAMTHSVQAVVSNGTLMRIGLHTSAPDFPESNSNKQVFFACMVTSRIKQRAYRKPKWGMASIEIQKGHLQSCIVTCAAEANHTKV